TVEQAGQHWFTFSLTGSSPALTKIGLLSSNQLDSLRKWIGKGPFDSEYLKQEDRPPSKNFFEVPQIRQSLMKLLKKEDFEKLTLTDWNPRPIELITDYLVVTMCKAHACPDEHVILAINMQSGSMHIGFWEKNNVLSSGKERWFSTKGNY